MQKCANCGHQNRPGVVFCENCGASLIGKLPLDTKSLESTSKEEKEQLGVDSSILTDVKIQGKATFNQNDRLRLDIEGSPEPIEFEPKVETIFGRRDPATGAMPDIDLTPFAGYRMGVSRRHAAIRKGDENTLDMWDLGSSNGTFLNGQRLSAHRPYRLHDGDELRLGQMIIRVFFKSVEEPAIEEKPETPEPAVEPEPVEKKLEVEAEAQAAESDVSAPAKAPEPAEASQDDAAPKSDVAPESDAAKAEESQPAQAEVKSDPEEKVEAPESATAQQVEAPDSETAKPAAPDTPKAPDDQLPEKEPPITTPIEVPFQNSAPSKNGTPSEDSKPEKDTSTQEDSEPPPKPEQPPD